MHIQLQTKLFRTHENCTTNGCLYIQPFELSAYFFVIIGLMSVKQMNEHAISY